MVLKRTRVLRRLLVGSSLLIAFLACRPETAEETAPGARPKAGSHPTARQARYEAILREAIDFGLPGLALAVDRPAESPWAGAGGHSNLITGTALAVTDPFHLASVTKAVTAMTTLRLIERGLIGLEEPVTEILEPSVTGGLANIELVQVRHLLDHSSGLYSFNNDPEYWRPIIGADAFSGREWTRRELLDFARRNEPSGAPGTAFHYADTNYLLLGEIIAARTGLDFKQAVRAEVLEPLGLESAYFYSDFRTGTFEPEHRPVEGYLLLSDVVREFGIHPDFPKVHETLVQATHGHERSDTAAGIVADVEDMRRFAVALFRPGFLSEASLAFLREPLSKLREAEAPEAGGVLRGYTRAYGALLAAEGDGPGGVHTVLAYHPASDTIVVAFTNSFGRFDESEFLFDRVIQPIVTMAP